MTTEAPLSLPPNWACATLQELTTEVAKVDPREEPDKPFLYVDISSVDNSASKVVAPKRYLGRNAPSRARQCITSGDILFSTVRTYLRNIAMVSEAHDGQVASTGFCVRRPAPCVEGRLLFLYVQTDAFVNKLSELQRGTSYPAVRDSDVRAQRVPLPPLPEQRRIVAKIEELFTRLDAGVEALERVQALLERYRQSVLKEAFEGRLTAAWREAHREELEPASVLLECIRREREAAEPKKGRRKQSREMVPVDACDLPELPKGWVWTTIGGVFDVQPGGTPSRQKPEYWSGDIAWVSSGEVANCPIRSTREQISELGLRNSSAKLQPTGSVLLAMIGQGRTRGQAALLEIPAATNQNVAAIRCSETSVHPQYVFHWLMARYEETRVRGGGGMQKALNTSTVKALPLPLCSYQEQVKVVQVVEERLSEMGSLTSDIIRARRHAGRLRQSILRHAFEGRLVPQDPTDEPAEVLLERIRAARQEQGRLL